MLNYLFERIPEYDENGNVVSHTVPRIAWVIMVGLLIFCFKDKVMKQMGGGDRQDLADLAAGIAASNAATPAQRAVQFGGAVLVLLGALVAYSWKYGTPGWVGAVLSILSDILSII